MKRVVFLLLVTLACSPNRPPPQVCENPPPEKRMHIGSCPISPAPEVVDAGGDAEADEVGAPEGGLGYHPP